MNTLTVLVGALEVLCKKAAKLTQQHRAGDNKGNTLRAGVGRERQL